MPRAVPLPRRQEIVARHEAGETLVEIAADLQMSYRTVSNLWSRYQRHGAAGLKPDYDRCSTPGPRFDPPLHEAALALKREHPRWGAKLIRVQLSGQFPEQPLPAVRTLQSWFRAAGLARRRCRRPSAARQRAKAAHQVWQLDGKEQIPHADGSRSVVLDLVDEATGAALSAASFPPG